MVRKNNTLLLVIGIMLLLFVGCKSKQQSIGGQSVEQKEFNKVLTDALDAELAYKTISTKGYVELKGQRMTTVFKLVKDSLIQASVRPLLGIEAMRLSITPDSVIIVDRLKKQYIAESFKDAMRDNGVAFNFYNLQALLTNQLFVAGGKDVTSKELKHFKVSRISDLYIARTTDKNKLTYDFSIDGNNRIISTFIQSEANAASLQFEYQDFVKDGIYVYPKTMQVDAQFKTKRIKFGVSYSKLDIDKNFNVDNANLSKYTKVGLKDLLSTYLK